MQYRYLGQSGLQVSALSFGSWITFGSQLDEDRAYQSMKAAYDAGVNFFDTAEVYSQGQAELILGNVIKKAGWKRTDLVISTKIFWGGKGPNDSGLSRKHLIEGTEASLGRLQLNTVDLLYCHRPDIHTPIEETVRAMTYLINQGKAMYWGTSEWSASQIMEAYQIARQEHLIPPTMEQPQYNMFHRERVEKEYLPLYSSIGLGTTIWSPLASGLLTGKYNDGVPKDSRLALEGYEWLRKQIQSQEGKERIEKVKKLTPIAKELNISMPVLALAWILKNPNVSSIITGASGPDQVKQNMKAVDKVDLLTPDAMNRIEKILNTRPKPVLDYRGMM
jgi:voltage-dependent potassium channel beta subunit